MDPGTQATSDRLRILEFSRENYCDQSKSPLFSVLPGEIRDRIFSFALAEFEDRSQLYDHDTCYRRPDYHAPRRLSTTLLRTCQRVYREAWFCPFASAEQTLFLTAPDRRPDRATTIENLEPSLKLVHKLHGDIELQSVRVFAQLCNLEDGHALQEILDISHFNPKSITVTIRHTDCWFWEHDDALHIDGEWVEYCRFPDSVRELRIQIESLERKKDQVDHIASQMMEKWNFRRRDKTVLTAKHHPKPIDIMRWSGSSTWNEERWVRDETAPETLEYYVATVTFRPTPASQPSLHFEPGVSFDIHELPSANPLGGVSNVTCVSTHELQQAGVPPGRTAQEALDQLNAWRMEHEVQHQLTLRNG